MKCVNVATISFSERTEILLDSRFCSVLYGVGFDSFRFLFVRISFVFGFWFGSFIGKITVLVQFVSCWVRVLSPSLITINLMFCIHK